MDILPVPVAIAIIMVLKPEHIDIFGSIAFSIW